MLIKNIGQAIKDSLDSPKFKSNASSKESRLMRTWNALLERSTTKPEDLYTVLANLIGFNAGYLVQSKDTRERMKAILFSLDQLPIDLLYIDAPKYRADSIDEIYFG